VFGPSGPTLSAERRERFEADREILGRVYPGLRHYILVGTGDALAEGPIEVDVGGGCFEIVEIRMFFGPLYPEIPPEVSERDARSRRWHTDVDRHIVAEGRFCLWLPHVDPPDVRTPERFRLFLLRLLLFLRDQFVFDDLGRWPGPAWPHGPVDAYAVHVRERLGISDVAQFRRLWTVVMGAERRPDRRCPCGSGRPYGRCHQRGVEALRWLTRRSDREAIKNAIEDQVGNSEPPLPSAVATLRGESATAEDDFGRAGTWAGRGCVRVPGIAGCYDTEATDGE
jgi:hypothetical protein